LELYYDCRMKKQFKNYIYIFILLCISLLLFIGVRGFSTPDITIDPLNPQYTISHGSGFYTHSIQVKLQAEHCKIYYTTDGTEPSIDSAQSLLYQGPITLDAGKQEQSHHLRIRFYEENGTVSKIYDFTYLLGHDIDKRFSTYVAHISGDPDELFGYENGIFVAGKLRDDYLAQHPEIEEAYNMDPANYNLRGIESERPVNFQLFDSTGTLLTSQNCGLRISGNFSRGKYQKSFQLFARKAYDEHGKFHLSLFPDIVSATDGTIHDRHNRLVFRNSGNDFGKAFIRDTLIQKLAMDAGLPMCTPHVPVAVYINNEYYGFYWIKEPFTEGQLEELYGPYNGSFEYVSINDCFVTATDTTEKLASDYQEIYDTYAGADLTVDATYEALCKRIDVDNYLLYYAIELFVANKDWPFNNMGVYRYLANDDVYYEDTLMDGRYRFLLFDTDYGFGLVDDVPGFAYDEDNVAVLIYNNHSPLFNSLMKRDDCRQKLVSYACDLMNTSFSYANIDATLSQLHSQREQELTYYVNHNLEPAISLTMETVNAEIDALRTFAQQRSGYLHGFLQTNFSIGNSYILNVSVDSRIKTSVNSIASVLCNDTEAYSVNRASKYSISSTTEDVPSIHTFSGIYYADCALSLKAQTDEGHEFSHFNINGQLFYEPEITLSPAEIKQLLIKTDFPGADGNITQADTLVITVEQTDKQKVHPVISQIHSKDENDMVELYNPSDHTISLNGYYLSDDVQNLKKTKIANKNLAPGESYFLYGEKNTVSRSIGIAKLGFNLRKEEILYLSDEKGTIIEQLTIPDMARVDTFYVRNPFTGVFRECE